jgi:UDPglucose--hexose-1-phosphate uridylyltransferase
MSTEPPSHYRHDPLQDHWIISAHERARRPTDRRGLGAFEARIHCPFCPGNEQETPPAIQTIPASAANLEASTWDLRVVPNKYPALSHGPSPERRTEGFYDVIPGYGAHEVVIETPHHVSHLADRPPEELGELLRTYRSRIVSLSANPDHQYVLVFKNHGTAAGASLAHPHSQIVAISVIPEVVATEVASSQKYFAARGRCLICDMLEHEIGLEKRIVAVNEDFVALCPFASRFPYELFVAPRQHGHDFTQTSDDQIESLARILGDVFAGLRRHLGDPAFNYILHTSPNPNGRSSEHAPSVEAIESCFHWHLEILPRLTQVAGFEWGTGFHINSKPAEDAAAELRG